VKSFLFLAILLILCSFLNAQTFSSVTDWHMPPGHTTGLTRPGFKIVPNLSFVNYGTEKHLVLKLDIEMGTARNPVGPFSFRYTYRGKEYTDNELGFDPFTSIRLGNCEFMVLVQGPNFSKRQKYVYQIQEDFGQVPKDALLITYSVRIESLENIYYRGTENIEKVILELQSNDRKKALSVDQAKVQQNTSLDISNSTTKKPNNDIASINNTPKQATQTVAPKEDFWSEKKTAASSNQSSGDDKVIPLNPNQKNLPDFIRTTNGGYYHRGADGRFREVTEEAYQQAKKAAANSNSTIIPEEKKMTADEVSATLNKMFADDRDRNAAIDAKVNQFSQAMQQNFYYAEAIRNGKQNLAEMSTLSGNYNSIAELEAAFNQKYSSIRSEVQGIEQSRNAILNNAVNNNFNGSSTEQSIGQGVALIGSFFNSVKASKEEREAKEALRAERQRQEKALIAAKQKARMDLRNQLLKTFPSGGTPLTAHKITLAQVYMFSYIVDTTILNNAISEVSVSNVFPVAQYSDGSYPLRTVVSDKLKGIAHGEVRLVGFYADKNAAEQMRNSFINLAQKSELGIKQVTVKSTVGNNSGSTATKNDFWETGKKNNLLTDTTKKKTDFWNN